MIDKNIYRPATLFALLWGIIFIVYSFHAFGLKQVSVDTYMIFLCGLLSFFAGSSIADIFRYKFVVGKHDLFSRKIKYRVYKFGTILFFIVMITPLMRASIFLLQGYSLYEIRYSLQNDILGTGIISILFNYFCEPYLTFMIVYSIANMFSEKRKIKNMFFTIVGIIFMTIISGGRFFILYFIASLGVAFLIYKKDFHKRRTKNEKKIMRRIKMLLLIAVVSIVTVSIIRGAKLGETIYVYLCGGIPFLEHLIKDVFCNSNYTNGAATCYGFIRPFFVILRKIGICDLPVWLQHIETQFLIVDDAYFLAPGILFNSFSTSFFAPYLDGGLLGVTIVYLIIGFVAEKTYKQINIKNECMISCFFLISLVVLLSFFRLVITHYSFSLAFIYLFFMSKPINRNDVDKNI